MSDNFNKNTKNFHYPAALTGNSAIFKLASFLAFSCVCQYASADVGVRAALTYVENPLQFEDAAEEDLIRSLHLDANYDRETPNFDLLFNYRAAKDDYKNNLQRDRTFIEGAGTINWKIVPEVLSWSLTNQRSNTVFDLRAPDNPNNQQVIDITTTGPSLVMPVTSSSIFSLATDYSVASYEESGWLDQVRKNANGSFSQRFSDVLTGSIKGTYSDTDYDDSALPGYDVLSLSAEAAFEFTNLSLAFELGRYKSDREMGDSETNRLIIATLSYRLNSRSTISSNYRETVEDQISDLSFWQGFNGFSFAGGGGVPGEFGSTNTFGLYDKESFSISYSYQVEGRYNLQFGYSDDERIFRGAGRDESNESISGNVGVPLSERMNLNFSARYSEYVYSQFSASLQERIQLTGGVSYRLGNDLDLGISLTAMDQESEDSLTNYDDFQALVSVSYRF